ncbi:MAG: phosphate ABC transporter permease subunit PstC [Candidatus Cloacimonadales bacterium]
MKKIKEWIFKSTIHLAALSALIILAGIIIVLFYNGLPIFQEVSLWEFISGRNWHPTFVEPEFGILPLITASFFVTILSMLISIPLGLGSAIYLSEIASSRVREIVKPIIELIAGIPSVVFGLFGLAFLAPLLTNWFGIPVGLNALNASIILGILVVPTISSVSEDALAAVPSSLREASLALGANRWETTWRVVLPAAKRGVVGSLILGFGRAVGETMVVIMIAGGAAQLPTSAFDPVRPMTSSIATEMAETPMGTPHFHALFGIAIVLFVITFGLNIITELAFRNRMK